MQKRVLARVLCTALVSALLVSGSVSASAGGQGAPGKIEAPPVIASRVEVMSLPTVTQGPELDVTGLLRKAPVVKGSGYVPSLPSAFVTIQEATDGSRIAVVDYTAPGAFKGTPRFDAGVLAELGVTAIRFITHREISGKAGAGAEPEIASLTDLDLAQWDTEKEVATSTAVADAEPADVFYEVEYWEDPWVYNSTLKTEYRYSNVPILKGGCANKTGLPIVNCTLTTTGEASVSVSSNLSVDKILQLGFQVGAKVSQTFTATVTSVPSGQMAVMQPKAEFYYRMWDEKRDVLKRTCYIGICGGWELAYREWTIGDGSRPTMLYYDVYLQTAP